MGKGSEFSAENEHQEIAKSRQDVLDVLRSLEVTGDYIYTDRA